MFIRPMGVTVHAANRPAGSPLLRGLLARASGAAPEAEAAGAVRPEEPPPRGLLARGVRAAEPELVEEPEPDPLDEPEPDPDYDYEPEPEPVDAVHWDPHPDAHPDAHPEPGPTAPAGLAAELRQLADLAREGLLTPQEFRTAKARLLND
ncbi:hypothetical protein [Streptomyces sp. NPDC090021]|uniref:SHOCT domain-containing protein n=1 Tax=Streptomyces sp. NPDC090021 TaxID=3365919 RepID=UPI003812F3A4